MGIPVECPLCGKQSETTLEAIDSRSPIECRSCHSSFALGDVFERLYNEEGLVRDSVDIVAKYATSQRELKVSDKKSRDATEQLLKDVGFEDLVRETARQNLVHGDAFLRIVRKGESVGWGLIPPARVAVKTSWAREAGWKSMALREDEFVFTTQEDRTVFTPDDVIHFRKSLFSYEQVPYGTSMIEICLGDLHSLRELRRIPISAKPGFQSPLGYLEENIILGLGVPKPVLEKSLSGLDAGIAQFIVGRFVGQVNGLRRILSDGFDRALERFANQKGLNAVPVIEFGRLQERRVLLDCGFDFSEEVRALRAVYEAGIISKEELDRRLGEYLP